MQLDSGKDTPKDDIQTSDVVIFIHGGVGVVGGNILVEYVCQVVKGVKFIMVAMLVYEDLVQVHLSLIMWMILESRDSECVRPKKKTQEETTI